MLQFQETSIKGIQSSMSINNVKTFDIREGLLIWVNEMAIDVLAQFRTFYPLGAENSLHGGVRSEVLDVLRIMEVLLLRVGQDPHPDIKFRDFLSLGRSDDGG